MISDPTASPRPKVAESGRLLIESGISGTYSQLWHAVVVMASVALYRPLVVWAQNAWDLAAPAELFVFGLPLFGIQVVTFFVLVAVGLRPAGAVLGVAGSMFVLLHWESLEVLPPTAWLLLVVGAAVAVHLRGSARLLRVVSILAAVVLVLAPAIQTAAAHVVSTESFPITDLSFRTPVNPTGMVEDVLVVVVDSYPSLRLAEDWFGHNSDELDSQLTAAGLTVQENGWSHNTFTGLAIPGLVELKPIVEPGPSGAWRNRRSTYELARGDNLVATSLQSAGFKYTHIESGWDGAHCGSNPDVCLGAHWFNEMSWKLFEASAIRSWLLNRYGNISVPGSLRVVAHLEGLAEAFDNGQNDYVFAHMILPHAPIVVDRDCNVRSGSEEDTGALDPEETEPESIDQLAPQLACVDSLLTRIVQVVGERTAVVIASDHGSNSGGQVHDPPQEWSDADIAERLGILLAYKVPTGCEQRTIDSSIDAMRMVVSCAVDIRLPQNDGAYLIGAEDPVSVDPARMTRIKHEVTQGVIIPDGD